MATFISSFISTFAVTFLLYAMVVGALGVVQWLRREPMHVGCSPDGSECCRVHLAADNRTDCRANCQAHCQQSDRARIITSARVDP